MGNIKQPRKGNFLQAAPVPSLEITLEQQLLAAIEGLKGQVERQSGQIRDLRTSLMGSGEPEHENEHGRLPKAEGQIKVLQVDVASKPSAAELQEVKAELKLVKDDVDVLKTARTSGAAHWNTAKTIYALLAACLIAVLGGGADAVFSALLRQH